MKFNLFSRLPDLDAYQIIQYNWNTFPNQRGRFCKNVLVNGFRDGSKAPFIRIKERLLQRSRIDFSLSLLFIKNWFEGHHDLRNIVASALQKSGYITQEPDFNIGDFEVQKLNEEDVYFPPESNLAFFYPSGQPILGYELYETTLMAFLLGWSAIDIQEILEAEQKENTNGIVAKKEKIIMEESNENMNIHPMDAILSQMNETADYLLNTSEQLKDGFFIDYTDVKEKVGLLKTCIEEKLSVLTQKLEEEGVGISFSDCQNIGQITEKITNARTSLQEQEDNYNTALQVLKECKLLQHQKNAEYNPLIVIQEEADRLIHQLEEGDNNLVRAIATGDHPIAALVEFVKYIGNTEDTDEHKVERFEEKIKTISSPGLVRVITLGKIGFENPEEMEIPSSEASVLPSVEVVNENPSNGVELIDQENRLEEDQAHITLSAELEQEGESNEPIISEAPPEALKLADIETEELEERVENDQVDNLVDEQEYDEKEMPETENFEDQLFSNPSDDAMTVANRLLNKKAEIHSGIIESFFWKLLAEKKLDMAFQFTNILASQSSHWNLMARSIECLLLGQLIRINKKEAANQLRVKLHELAELAYNEEEKSKETSLILMASALIPRLTLKDYYADTLLIENSVDGFPKLSELINMVTQGAYRDVYVNAKSLSQFHNQTEWEEAFRQFQIEFENWKHAAPRQLFGQHLISKIWTFWLRNEDYIGQYFDLLTKANPTQKDIEKIENAVSNYFQEDEIKKEISKTGKNELGYKVGVKDHKSLEWIKVRTFNFRDLMEEWLNLHYSHPRNKKSYQLEQSEKLLAALREMIPAVILEIREAVVDHQKQSALQSAGITLIGVFEHVTAFTNSKLSPLVLSSKDHLNGILLKTNENVDRLTEEALMKTLIRYDQTWENVFSEHTAAQRFEKAQKVLNILNQLETNEMDLKEFEKQVAEAANKFEFTYQKKSQEIEDGVAKGFINEDERLRLIGKLVALKKEVEENKYVDFPQYFNQLDEISSELTHIKREKIKNLKMQIPVNVPEEQTKNLHDLLEKGDFITAHELLSTYKGGKVNFQLPEIQHNTFLDYFPEKLDQINSFLSQSGSIPQAIPLIKDKKNPIPATSFDKLESSRLGNSIEMLEQWMEIKNGKARKFSSIADQSRMVETFEKFLTNLGWNAVEIDVENIGEDGKDGILFNFNCEPVKERRICPIPFYGSQANGSYRVYCVWKKLSVEEILNTTASLNTRRPFLVFYFDLMNVKDRYHEAEMAYTNSRDHIVVDQNLIFYLASVPGHRLPMLFNLTLPFCYFEPYTTSASVIPPEMFFGRFHEKQQLLNPMGSCFIYGGRQLGKTVLLRELEKDFDNPDEGQVSLWIDLKAEGIGSHQPIDDIGLILYRHLREKGLEIFPEQETPTIKIKKVLEHITTWITKEKNRRMILFLDEADRFLEEDAKEEFKVATSIKSAMEDTNKRFKVVFAGLHNVKRTTTLANHPLGHFGEAICIGPLLDNFEAKSAMELVRVPLDSLGFQFEDESLVLRILTLTNYYPSLIQIFCQKLLKYLHGLINSPEFKGKECPPYIIRDRHVSQAYNDAKPQIEDKFKLTLQLDQRYNLLAHIIAFHHYANDGFKAENQGVSVQEIQKDALYYWKEGMAESSDFKSLVHLLDEMEGLGVLRKVSEDHYTLRTPNILSLLGSKAEVESVLLTDNRVLAKEYQPNIFRVNYTSRSDSSVHKIQMLSSIVTSEYYGLQSPENSVNLIIGNKLNGLDCVEPFLKEKLDKKFFQFHFYSQEDSFTQFEEDLQKALDRRTDEQPFVVVFKNKTNWNIQWIDHAVKKIDNLSSPDKHIKIVFLVNSDQHWNFIENADELYDQLLNHKILNDIKLKPWHKDVVEGWFKTDQGFHDLDLDQLNQVTGYWHELLMQFYLTAIEERHRALDYLNNLKETLEGEPSYILKLAGLSNDPFSLKIFEVYDGYEEPLTASELTALMEDEIPDLEKRLKHLSGMNWLHYVNSTGKYQLTQQGKKLCQQILKTQQVAE